MKVIRDWGQFDKDSTNTTRQMIECQSTEEEKKRNN